MSRNTVTRLAKTLGVSEMQVIHVALAQFAHETPIAYEPDNESLIEGNTIGVKDEFLLTGIRETAKVKPLLDGDLRRPSEMSRL